MNERNTCDKCPIATFRTEKMPSCKNCNRGFSTNGEGANSPQKCNVVFCPKGDYLKGNYL
jgi:hypothetical protein